MAKILDPFVYIRSKIAHKNFAGQLTTIVYQYCTNPNCRPTSLDKVMVVGYCQALRTNHGLLPDQYCNDFDENRDEFNIIVLYNKETKWYTYVALPVINYQHDIYKYIFASGDYCYWDIRDGLDDDTSIIANSSGDELLVETSGFDQGDIPGTKLFPKNFIDFSKLCLKYCGKAKKPSQSELVHIFNEE